MAFSPPFCLKIFGKRIETNPKTHGITGVLVFVSIIPRWHTASSLMINSDIPTKVISEQLGHANTVITENTYGHVFAESKVKAMQAIETRLNLG